MRLLLEGEFGPITWKRRSYLYEQGLLIRKALVRGNLSVINDVDSGDEKVEGNPNVMPWQTLYTLNLKGERKQFTSAMFQKSCFCIWVPS